jgi:hypothetical protein
MGSGHGRAGVSRARVSLAQLRLANIIRQRLALRPVLSACDAVALGLQTEWWARGRGMCRVSGVSACGGATGRKRFADTPAFAAVCCAAACAPRPACHPPGAVERRSAARLRSGCRHSTTPVGTADARVRTEPGNQYRVSRIGRFWRGLCQLANWFGALDADTGIPRSRFRLARE